MWNKVAHIILKYRLLLIGVLGIITVFMGYKARDIEMTYDFAKVVPSDDPDMVYFQQFKETYGEDGNILVIGLRDSAVYTPQNFRRLKYLSREIQKIEGVQYVLSYPGLQRMEKDTEHKRFTLNPIFETVPDDQAILDSLLTVAADQKFYSGQIINPDNGALLLLVTIDKEVLNSSQRDVLVEDVQFLAEEYSAATGIELHYAGLPFLRSVMSVKVKDELNLFLVLSAMVTALILFFFFRSWNAVIFPMIIIGVMVVWVMGTLALLGYKITLLTGLIPSIIVVIGIPNSIYLLNKYHQEYARHGNQILALSRMIRKIGLVALISNFTTAIGFIVLAFTDIVILKELGVVAGLNVFATFFVSIILIPAIFSYLPPPNARQLRHLDFKLTETALTGIDLLVHRYKYRVFVVTGIIIGLSVVGLLKVYSVSHMVDGLPEKSRIKQDMAFFQRNFSGVMPLELVIDTGEKRGVIELANLQRVARLDEFLASLEHVNDPVSLVDFVKVAKQAYYNNNPAYYALPNRMEKNFIYRYLRDQSDSSGLLQSFVDSTGQTMRVSVKIADIGSIKMDSLVNTVIVPEIDEIFGDSDTKVTVTGTTPLFVKGNKFLIDNLKSSLLLAVIIIAMIMAALFWNYKMIIISLIPNMVPLLMTAGLMGYLGIPLKPSSALIFSIVFGISVDDSIHFLAKYRQELFNNNFFVPIAVSKSIQETGASMMYTSIVLFAGFVIFVGSEFGGTIALGALASTTLLIAMVTNLILLPSLLLAFDDGKRNKKRHPPIEHYDEFYQEDEDEEIDLGRIKVKDPSEEYAGEN